MDLAGYRRLSPALADALVTQVIKVEQQDAELRAEVIVAAAKAIQSSIMAGAMGVAKTVAARPV